MSLRAFYVKPNWEEIAARAREDRIHLQKAILGIFVVSTLLLFILQRLSLPVIWLAILSQACSLCIYGATAVWFALRPLKLAPRVAFCFYSAVVLFSSLALYLAKVGFATPFLEGSQATGPPLYAGIFFFASWPFLVYLARSYPDRFRKIGFTLSGLLRGALLGLIAGASLGMHCLVSSSFAGNGLINPKPLPYIAWHLSYEAGLQSLAEEMFFRGVVFNFLYTFSRKGFWPSCLITCLFNVGVYLVIPQWTGNLMMTIGVSFYVFMMALVNTFLYRSTKSLLAPYLCNVTFGLIALFR
ncbi:MAG TPA: CPBP family intramembrane metalloprotease [Chloroflexi bacterium]|nr:CPBP family intramembrane metalloprotease [Chloroflexota bacterium]